jgi:hypothetical protein
MKRTLNTIVGGILFLAQASLASACPMCKYALESNEYEPLAYMISILFMMGTISTLFFSVAGLLWWVTVQEKKKLTAAGYEHLFENAGNQPHLAKVNSNQL